VFLLIVVKIGGDLIAEGIPHDLLNEIASVVKEQQLILVHGGGDIVTKISTELGHPPRFVLSPRGFRSRYTSKEESVIYTMVMAGKINKEIVSALQGRGVQAVGLSGLDGALVRARRKERIITIDERGRRMLLKGGYTGKIEEVNQHILSLLIANGYTPIVSSIAIGNEAEPLNVDGDRMASSLASAMGAEKLILLTDVDRIYLDDRPIEKLNLFEAKEILDKIGPGMITKLYAAIEALDGSVREVVISSGFIVNPITSALLHKVGTVIVR
jgi:acetylglutamate/LysW-gamma-L-alpha-aminoadipate kinase